jgi:hypothetical protein
VVKPGEARSGPRRIFLAGPLSGAAPWRAAAREMIADGVTRPVIVVDPTPTAQVALGDVARVSWENDQMRRAVADGVIVFWMARQVRPTRMKGDFPRPFGMNSRFELGFWLGQASARDSLAIGIESGCVDEGYLRAQAGLASVAVCDSLAATCTLAISLLDR